MADRRPTFLCIATYEKGQAFIREIAAQDCGVILITVEKLRHADWPFESLEEILTIPEQMPPDQFLAAVSYMARTRHFDRVVALDEFDMETAAATREHMRIPGMGQTTTRYFRDKLAMRVKAAKLGIDDLHVPEFVSIFNYDDVKSYTRNIPGPWLLKPRSDASAIGIRKIQNPDDLWPVLDELGDRQSHFLLERFVPGEIYHVDAVTSEGEVVFAAVHKYGKPPMQVMHEGGIFTTRTLDRNSHESRDLTALNAQLVPGLGMVRGVTHTEFTKAHGDGRYYFLETAGRVGGAYIAELMESSAGINPWREWARIEVAHMKGVPYHLPSVRHDYAGSVLCLARQAEPDTSAYSDPEIVYRMKKHHHAGVILRSHDPERIRTLLEQYAQSFARDFGASMPVPDRPTA